MFLSDPEVTFYALYNYFFYTQMAFVLYLQKDLHCSHGNIDDFHLFLLQKNFVNFRGLFFCFLFFFILIPFTCLFSKSFFDFFCFDLFCFFFLLIKISWHFYIYEEIFDRFFLRFKT